MLTSVNSSFLTSIESLKTKGRIFFFPPKNFPNTIVYIISIIYLYVLYVYAKLEQTNRPSRKLFDVT